MFLEALGLSVEISDCKRLLITLCSHSPPPKSKCTQGLKCKLLVYLSCKRQYTLIFAIYLLVIYSYLHILPKSPDPYPMIPNPVPILLNSHCDQFPIPTVPNAWLSQNPEQFPLCNAVNIFFTKRPILSKRNMSNLSQI